MSNESGSSRLDRTERTLDKMAEQMAEAHTQFRQEHKQLLTPRSCSQTASINSRSVPPNWRKQARPPTSASTLSSPSSME
jgi:hypothetical protein